MKKLALLFTSICICMGSFAQDPVEENTSTLIPSDGKKGFSLEVLIGQNLGDGNSVVTAPGVKIRYFINDNMAIRFGLDYSSWLSENVATENGDGSGAQGTQTFKNATFNTKVGFEYHFEATKRLSPYVAIDLVYGVGSYNEEGVNHDGFGYNSGYNYTEENRSGSFGTSFIAGLDFYVAQNLFLGTEFGYSYKWNVDKEGTYMYNDNGVENTIKTPKEKSRFSGFSAVGGIRLGWRF